MQKPYLLTLNQNQGYYWSKNEKEFLSALGNNAGNMVFGSAMQRVLKGGFPANSMQIPSRKKFDSTGCDGIVIAAANWLQPRVDLGLQLQQLKKLNTSVVICGLGAQSIDNNIPELNENTVKYLKLISDSSNYISVRGNFTAEVLANYGIHNVIVTGCPSLLWHVDHPAAIQNKPIILHDNKISMNATIPAKDFSRKILDKRMILAKHMVKNCIEQETDLVVQTELPMMRFKNGNQVKKDLEYLSPLFHPYTIEDSQKWATKHVKYFGSVSDWIAYCANKSFVLGTRLHGVITSLLAGTPSMLVTHDQRTMEMSRKASIPNISSEEILSMTTYDFAELRQRIDIEAFNHRQKLYFSDFKDFFRLNDVPTSLA
ncbi:MULTISPECIES: polysaccharide pyruvyl transferase family protein [unclassified Synechococcus]|uniref:polysaccharide pyruvyl transferase family protein n=1 Tax=unclassified Synechococcus TaxID=2626047 RepID=UPI0039AEE564